MANSEPLRAASKCTSLQVSDEDWDAAPAELLETMLVQILTIRTFEQTVLKLASQGLLHGPAHSSIGQEGAAVGAILALQASDGINGTHRGHHQFLAKGLNYLRPGGMTAVDGIKDDEIVEFLRRTLWEILGLKGGFSGGRGGSMHLQWLEAGALGTNAIVGGGVPLAAGNAWTQKHANSRSAETSTCASPGATVTFFGDGAINIGSTLETMNLAAAWELPLCFFVENNLYAVATHIDEVTGEPRLALRGPGFGIESWHVDGMDPLAVYLAQTAAVQHMREGRGPTLIEAETYRYYHQNGPIHGSAFGYRSKEEEQRWKERDPLATLTHHMERRRLINLKQIDDLQARISEVIGRILEEDILSSDGGDGKTNREIKPELWPDPRSINDDIRGANALTPQEPSPQATPVAARFVDVIADVLKRRMETDDGVVVIGEDIQHLRGGTNGATRGLKAAFPNRTLGAPISENAFTGLAGGIAMSGKFRPVVELMYADFIWVAADQLFNQIGKIRHMFGGRPQMPLVLRTKVAMGGGYGSQHSMDPIGVFATNPGWRIVAPTTPHDYIGLMNTAMQLKDPVAVIEHIDLYSDQGNIPEGDLDFTIPVGSAAVRREGSKVTVLSYLNMVDVAVQAAEERPEMDAEVIDLRWLDQASLDWATISASIKKTNNVLIVEQGSRGTSYGGWLADEIQRRLFDYLDQPVQRVTGSEAWPSVSKVLESSANAGLEDVLEGLDVVAANLGLDR